MGTLKRGNMIRMLRLGRSFLMAPDDTKLLKILNKDLEGRRGLGSNKISSTFRDAHFNLISHKNLAGIARYLLPDRLLPN